MTQVELAKRAYGLPNFIGQIERGQTNPSLVSIAPIAAALGCDVWDLFVPDARQKNR
jgi:transcriptional regulator with XRE-family HTH domain